MRPERCCEWCVWRITDFHKNQQFATHWLELAVHAAQHAADSRTHRLVADIDNDRDCGQDQRIFSHRLTVLMFAHLHKYPRDHIHCPVSSFCLFLPKLVLSTLVNRTCSTLSRSSMESAPSRFIRPGRRKSSLAPPPYWCRSEDLGGASLVPS